VGLDPLIANREALFRTQSRTPIEEYMKIVVSVEALARGAAQKLFNSSLEGNVRRAIDFREEEMMLQATHARRGGG
jgi:hypothetical protein